MPQLPTERQSRTSQVTWRMTWTLPTTPRCPGCGTALREDTVLFKDGISLCIACAMTSDLFRFHIRTLLCLPCFGPHIRMKAGLVFWTPSAPLKPDASVFEAMEVLPIPPTECSPSGFVQRGPLG